MCIPYLHMFRSSHFSFLVTFGDEVTKIRKYYVIFVYILQGKMGKTRKRKENHATKLTKIPKTKRRKYWMDCCLLQFHVKNDQTQMQHKWCISRRKTYHSIETHFEWHEIDTQRADQLMRLLPMAIFVWPWSNAVKKTAWCVLYSQAWKKITDIHMGYCHGI